jgi:hypothetical protein
MGFVSHANSQKYRVITNEEYLFKKTVFVNELIGAKVSDVGWNRT